ncbi:helix-turn-helix domain-containing protein [Rhizobium ruizarguesonis]|uniref:helix-turn-helix domain-containing protein n=1 Tax=Rhizobium ruizarguesonis TaxID=2081791 RepID=UPI001030AAB2|nr:helix-turn-helix domain-containing protein [Rhizobium ruizarguesonis]
MKSYAPPDTLRAARALLRLSQGELGKEIGFSRQSVSAAENDPSSPMPTIAKMREFYEKKGLQFLGTVDIDTGRIDGAGVRWRPPPSPPTDDVVAGQFHAESEGAAFEAARSLLGRSRALVAQEAKVPFKELGALEAGEHSSTETVTRLRDYFANSGIEFLGWGDLGSRTYFGVGVRWRSLKTRS